MTSTSLTAKFQKEKGREILIAKIWKNGEKNADGKKPAKPFFNDKRQIKLGVFSIADIKLGLKCSWMLTSYWVKSISDVFQFRQHNFFNVHSIRLKKSLSGAFIADSVLKWVYFKSLSMQIAN